MEALICSCSKILLARAQDEKEYEYSFDGYRFRPDRDRQKPALSHLTCQDGTVVEHVIPLRQVGGGKKRQMLGATLEARNGDSVERCIPISGHNEWTLYTDDDADTYGMRLRRYVGGVRGEFLPEAREELRELAGYSQEQSQGKIKHLRAYIAWATRGLGTEPSGMNRGFPYRIRYSYPAPSRNEGPVEMFHVTQENGSVIYRPVPVQQMPDARRHADKYGDAVTIFAQNGDGIKEITGGGEVYFYFPFEGELYFSSALSVPDRQLMTESRFFRYVDGYRREILPEAQSLRSEAAASRLDRDLTFDTAKRIAHNRMVNRLDEFISWLRAVPLVSSNS